MSKGSKPRPHDKCAFDDGYERIFRKRTRPPKTPEELFNQIVNDEARQKLEHDILQGIDVQALSMELGRSIACALVERGDNAFYVGVTAMAINTQDDEAQVFNDKIKECALEFINLYQSIKDKN